MCIVAVCCHCCHLLHFEIMRFMYEFDVVKEWKIGTCNLLCIELCMRFPKSSFFSGNWENNLVWTCIEKLWNFCWYDNYQYESYHGHMTLKLILNWEAVLILVFIACHTFHRSGFDEIQNISYINMVWIFCSGKDMTLPVTFKCRYMFLPLSL